MTTVIDVNSELDIESLAAGTVPGLIPKNFVQDKLYVYQGNFGGEDEIIFFNIPANCLFQCLFARIRLDADVPNEVEFKFNFAEGDYIITAEEIRTRFGTEIGGNQVFPSEPYSVRIAAGPFSCTTSEPVGQETKLKLIFKVFFSLDENDPL